MYIIIHSKHDKESREFVNQYSEGYKVIDFYDYDNPETQRFSQENITVSDFPSVVDMTSREIVIKPISMEDAINKLAQKQTNKRSILFLALTDYKVVRHYEQKLAGIECSMTDEEFTQLMIDRQSARESIV